MVATRTNPDLKTLSIPIDAWTQPFWQGTAHRRLLFPRCVACGTFRWPPGPFCPACQSQEVDWIEPRGTPRLYSFTVVAGDDGPIVPALVQFDDIPGIRLLTSIIDIQQDALRIGLALSLDWRAAADQHVPVFRGSVHALAVE